MCTTCSECVRRCVCWCKKHTCVTYTPAHALMPKTPVSKCMQHSLQKNAHTNIFLHTYIKMHIQIYSYTHIYPSTPHPLFPIYPRTVRKNGPLRSCRKIRGKTAVQQSPSRWARRTSSPRMTRVTVHGETKSQWGTTKPATAHHTITTARRPDNIHSSALVRGRSTQFMASPCRWPQRRSPETRLHFRQFRGLFLGVFSTVGSACKAQSWCW